MLERFDRKVIAYQATNCSNDVKKTKTSFTVPQAVTRLMARAASSTRCLADDTCAAISVGVPCELLYLLSHEQNERSLPL